MMFYRINEDGSLFKFSDALSRWEATEQIFHEMVLITGMRKITLSQLFVKLSKGEIVDFRGGVKSNSYISLRDKNNLCQWRFSTKDSLGNLTEYNDLITKVVLVSNERSS
jgi:hypothetical protein